MSSIAAMGLRRAFARPSTLRMPTRRFASSKTKIEESGLDKGPKRDPELYVRLQPLLNDNSVLRAMY